MGIELHIRSASLGLLVARQLQQTLATANVAPVSGIYVDHIDPVPDQLSWSAGDEGTTVLRIPLDVYAVSRSDLLAHPNTVSPGATTPAGRVSLVIVVSASGGVLSLKTNDVELGAAAAVLGEAASRVRDALLAAAGSAPHIDLSAILSKLGIDPATAPASVVLTGDLLVARFGTFASPPAPVGHRYEWGLYLDGPSIEALIRARIPQSIPPLQSVSTSARWQPYGTNAYVTASVDGPVEVPDPATLRVSAGLGCTLTMPEPKPEIRVDVTYTIDLDAGGLGFIPAVAVAISVIEDTVLRTAIDPAKFGGVRTSDSSFRLTVPLPEIRVGKQAWHYEGMTVGPAGLVVGGAVDLPVDVPKTVVRAVGVGFTGGHVAFLFCSHSEPQTDVPLAKYFSTVATVRYEHGGNLCEVEVLPGGMNFERQLTIPRPIAYSDGLRPGDGLITMGFDVESAELVETTIQLVVRTSRGVRCFNLGRPEHVTILADGTVEGGLVLWLDDCDYLPPNFGDMTPAEYERWSGLIWYTYWGLVPGEDYDPENPPILPETLQDIPADWSDVPIEVLSSATETQVEVTVPAEFSITTQETASRAVVDTTAVAGPAEVGVAEKVGVAVATQTEAQVTGAVQAVADVGDAAPATEG